MEGDGGSWTGEIAAVKRDGMMFHWLPMTKFQTDLEYLKLLSPLDKLKYMILNFLLQRFLKRIQTLEDGLEEEIKPEKFTLVVTIGRQMVSTLTMKTKWYGI